MSYTIELRADGRILWETWGADFDPETETEAATHKELELLDAARQPMVAVVDMRLVPLDLDDIIYLANHGVPEELANHPRLNKIILITTDEVVAQSAEGMDSEPFGFIKFGIVSSPEEALAQARESLA